MARSELSDIDAATSQAAAEPPSTGFLPLTLALSLFVAGLFILGFVPGVSCGDTQVTQPASR